MRRTLYSLVFLFVSFLTVNAQSGSSGMAVISGRVADSLTSEPMAAATISLIDRKTGNASTGTISNQDGEFILPDIPFGNYDVVISFIGYQEVKRENVTLGSGNSRLSLGTIMLKPSSVNLGDVEVVAEKPVIENRFDKIVYNVASDVTSQGTLALDVLRKVPQVTVDAEGNVELQGNSNIRFLINGKESSIFGNNVSDALASIPASQIRTIEAITNPGSKYDLQGTGGVINIILVENRLRGTSGNFNLSAGTRNQTGSVNLGVKRGKIGINGYFSGNRRIGIDGDFSSLRETYDPIKGISTSLTQNGLGRNDRNGYRAGLGIDWDITEKLKLTGTAGYNNFSFGSSGIIDLYETETDNGGTLLSELSTARLFKNDRKTGSLDWNINMKKNFAKEGHSLDFILNSSYGRPVSYYSLTLSDYSDANSMTGSESRNPGTDNTTTIQSDYVYPLSGASNLEAGVKGTFNNITSHVNARVFDPSAGAYVPDPIQSYDLGYTLNIYAAYLSASFNILNWLDVKPGARYEYSDIAIDFPGASVPSYGTLVPSILLSHKLGEKKSVQLSYTRRIRRPGYNDLNPFINRSDPYNIETGNVLLKPEVGDRIELSYSTGFGKGGNLRVTLAQRIDSREIENITAFYPEYIVGDSVYRNVSVTTRLNAASEYNSGLNIFGSFPVTSKLSLRTNLMLFHNYLVTNQSEGSFSAGFRFRGNFNATWQLPEKLVLEFFGFWRSGGRAIQGREPDFYIYNLALRKLFWKDNASFGLTATNFIARDIRQVTTVRTVNSISRTVRELPFRSFGASFTYKFGKMQSRPDRDNEADQFGGNND